jgi:two-component system chemotaxis sensor kinase CheA
VGIDTTLADAIAEPLLHLVRNAVGHGIETPEERIAAGKQPMGKVKLAAFSEGSLIHISISDDGRGIDLDRVVAAASKRGIADQGPTFTMDQGLRLIFRPGFSTMTEVSELSGRGIGLDIVDRAMEQAGGEVRVATEPGVGTTFAMILPAALALVECVIVRSAEQFYCIESSRASSLGSLEEGRLKGIAADGLMNWQGEELPFVRLRNLLAQPYDVDPHGRHSLVVWQVAEHRAPKAAGHNRCALLVDDIAGQQETLVRSLGRHAARWPGVSGAAELLDGNVALVLDLGELMARPAES